VKYVAALSQTRSLKTAATRQARSNTQGEEVLDLLARNEASYVNGEVLGVTGGPPSG
jgi:hypothetical protein